MTGSNHRKRLAKDRIKVGVVDAPVHWSWFVSFSCHSNKNSADVDPNTEIGRKLIPHLGAVDTSRRNSFSAWPAPKYFDPILKKDVNATPVIEVIIDYNHGRWSLTRGYFGNQENMADSTGEREGMPLEELVSILKG